MSSAPSSPGSGRARRRARWPPRRSARRCRRRCDHRRRCTFSKSPPPSLDWMARRHDEVGLVVVPAELVAVDHHREVHRTERIGVAVQRRPAEHPTDEGEERVPLEQGPQRRRRRVEPVVGDRVHRRAAPRDARDGRPATRRDRAARGTACPARPGGRRRRRARRTRRRERRQRRRGGSRAGSTRPVVRSSSAWWSTTAPPAPARSLDRDSGRGRRATLGSTAMAGAG